jgi:hypothetical protein
MARQASEMFKNMSPDDASVAAALADARAAAVAAGVDVSAAASDASAAVAAVVEDELDDDEPPPLINAASAPPAMDAAALAKAREAMRADPSMMKNMGDMMANMSEDQIAAMSAMTPPGMPVRTDSALLALLCRCEFVAMMMADCRAISRGIRRS